MFNLDYTQNDLCGDALTKNTYKHNSSSHSGKLSMGFEKDVDVIIISNARSSGIGFLASPQRLNVAITRPKKCLILCENFKNLEAVPAWRSLLDSARERKLFHDISTDCIYDIQANVTEKIKLKKVLQETNSN
ncbi:hypothetical protein GQX74_014870 [Glossina fuscipes]|nr:hypothetical protein GQX74_014870 [Glossina fuscipes]